jgi:hypothetical protein
MELGIIADNQVCSGHPRESGLRDRRCGVRRRSLSPRATDPLVRLVGRLRGSCVRFGNIYLGSYGACSPKLPPPLLGAGGDRRRQRSHPETAAPPDRGSRPSLGGPWLSRSSTTSTPALLSKTASRSISNGYILLRPTPENGYILLRPTPEYSSGGGLSSVLVKRSGRNVEIRASTSPVSISRVRRRPRSGPSVTPLWVTAS